MDDAMDCLMSFSDFLFAFQIQFYYSGESLPGPSGSCRDLTPRPALGPAVCVSGPHVSASPPCAWRASPRAAPQDVPLSPVVTRLAQPPHGSENHGASRQQGDTSA